MVRNSKFIYNAIQICRSLVFVLMSVTAISAQSLDPGSPTPIRSANLLGKIAARDLGDSRLTDHYYMFKGTPGDLLITVQSRNLNGDLDVFTAVTLRPLLKLSLYAENTRPVTKAIYLRKPEDLILRVEARSPNDDEGTYQLFFGGSFEAIAGVPDIAETEDATTAAATTTSSGGRKTKRATSVGARIDEPEPPVAEVAAAPTPTPEPTPEARPEESPAPAKVKPVESAKTTAPRNTRTRRPAGRRTTTSTPTEPKETATTAPEETKTEEAKKEEEPKKEESSTASAETESKPKPASRGTPKRSTSPRSTTPKPTPEPDPEIGPRLIIETNDGTLVNRSMSTVRRVTVEAGWVVVTGKDGKVDRVLLVNVVRMSIAP
jgi:hypothetical protein